MIHRIEVQVGPNGAIVLDNLPLKEGETVEILILTSQEASINADSYSLRGAPVLLDQPFEPVAEHDWEALA
ncbi:MAG: hypothetical protein SF339_07005 [Blastocatellia bacterium]|nr:hypothetical protein [Blastocatellia bacterium]